MKVVSEKFLSSHSRNNVMKKIKPDTYSDFRWVILLLAVAVILPTICLLWFMTQAVKNVQFAARQLLIDEYSRRVDEQINALDKIWDERIIVPTGIADVNVFEIFHSIVSDNSSYKEPNGVVIFDKSGKIAYPIIESKLFDESEPPEEFEEAWELEFVEKNFAEAEWAYESLSVTLAKNATDINWRKAILGAARCFQKDGNTQKAKAFFEMAGWGGRITPNISSYEASLCAQARVMFAGMFDEPNAIVALDRLSFSAISYETGDSHFLPMDSATRIFVQSKTLQLWEEKSYILKDRIDKTKKLLAAEQISNIAAQSYNKDISLSHAALQNVFRLDVPEEVYGKFKQSENRGFLFLWSGSSIRHDFENFNKTFTGSDIIYRITDNEGLYVSGTEKTVSNAFLKIPMGENSRDWHIELFFANNKVFENAANKQVAIYIWAGVLVIVLILATGGLAGRSIGRQMKMNKLKNDFIATITHELKTPLASMRVLADTLLEGNYSKRGQDALDTTKEYLELICKENKRLTSLIDNFLTFSRMERNKQVFEFEKVSPADIAKSAVEAVQTKFNQNNCAFSVTINGDLPSISADKDAMVTVLVNLLDNAYKYTYDNKKIELKVFSEGKNVCFSVKDNGIGMTRRQMRKIFDRFYQADSTLSRRAEGTGLGLSIVKFILDAHKATIEVKSQPEKGSTFIVKIPILP